ncbi:hypothetical protein [Dyadobacter sp. NIV53]|uniref:hypothetical protein n=1 Tax=Dyadobacter sp. NIV53 TaxID=2861765 RepID=UPI001C885946|nr:hypothetical protein [Dyadobacter sp. NIV53]
MHPGFFCLLNRLHYGQCLNSASGNTKDKISLNSHIFAVYDSCVTDSNPDSDLAFIEERLCSDLSVDQADQDEHYFSTLSEAKTYVHDHFSSGAEYFSLKQSHDPDNFIFLLMDKISYFMA